MANPENEFHRELEVFGNEANEAIQCFYAFQAVHNFARVDRRVYGHLNRYAAFWNPVLRALQTNSLIALGRIFDRDSRSHSVGRLLDLAEAHPEIFSTAALKERKRKQSPDADKWIDSFMKDRYVPTLKDFKRLRRYVAKNRAIYDRAYRAIRNKFYAHHSRIDLRDLFAKTNTREFEKLLVFLPRLHDALWNLLHNGLRPVLRPARYSARRILELPPSKRRKSSEQEWITHATKDLLKWIISPDWE